MGTFRRGTWHTKRKMKSFTDFLLVGFVTMLWSTSVNGDGNAPNATGVLGFDENYCSGKPNGEFCKAREYRGNRPFYNRGECCDGKCFEAIHELGDLNFAKAWMMTHPAHSGTTTPNGNGGYAAMVCVIPNGVTQIPSAKRGSSGASLTRLK